MNLPTFFSIPPRLQSRIKRRANFIAKLEDTCKNQWMGREEYFTYKDTIAKCTTDQILDKQLMQVYVGTQRKLFDILLCEGLTVEDFTASYK